MMAELREMPEPVALFMKESLYVRYQLDPGRIRAVERFRSSIDLYCVECGKTSIFKSAEPPIAPNLDASGGPSREAINRRTLRRRAFIVTLHCGRRSEHTAYFIFRVGPESFCKIGQFPTVADQHYPSLKKYAKLLGTYQEELTKAVGLFAHGIGVGSFVYLRRIFEHLVTEVAQGKNQREPNWDIKAWQSKRMDEKIEELGAVLPPFLVQNKSIYSVLSKGIHELNEPECLSCFEVVRTGIELILDERLTRQKEEEKKRRISGAIARIKGRVSGQ